MRSWQCGTGSVSELRCLSQNAGLQDGTVGHRFSACCFRWLPGLPVFRDCSSSYSLAFLVALSDSASPLLLEQNALKGLQGFESLASQEEAVRFKLGYPAIVFSLRMHYLELEHLLLTKDQCDTICTHVDDLTLYIDMGKLYPLACSCDCETLRQLLCMVTMTHPDLLAVSTLPAI